MRKGREMGRGQRGRKLRGEGLGKKVEGVHRLNGMVWEEAIFGVWRIGWVKTTSLWGFGLCFF
jgi:hypothetical protein